MKTIKNRYYRRIRNRKNYEGVNITEAKQLKPELLYIPVHLSNI
jgi:hypothetical protein